MSTAAIVPSGSERPGFLRLPERAIPASMPVTAGKKTAKTTQNDSFSGTMATGAKPSAGADPAKNEINDSAIAAMIRNWVLSARSADR